MQRRWRNGLGIVLLASLAAATWLAALQPPHPSMFRPIGLWDVGRADWWLHPLERNAFKRLVVRGDLHSLAVLPDGSRIWAVGEGGLILHSRDGGRSWQQQRPVKPRTEAQESAAASRRNFDWLPSAHAAAGPQPDVKQAPSNSFSPVQQIAPPANSKDADVPPSAQQPLTGDGKGSTSAEGRLDAVVPTEPNAQRRSPRKSSSTPSPASTSAAPARKDRAAAVAPEPAASAPTPRVRTDGEADLRAVAFVNDTMGWAVGDAGRILWTQDGGDTWMAQPSGTGADLQALWFTDDGLKAWVVGDSGTVLFSANRGTTWQPQTSDTTAHLRSIDIAPNARDGWAVSDDGRVLVTRDGGERWSLSPVVHAPGLASVQFDADMQTGRALALDGNGGGFETRDGGITWSKSRETGPGTRIHWVSVAADGRRAWAVGPFGRLHLRDDVGRWLDVDSGTQADLHDVRFASDARRGWAVGGDGTLLASRDGGRSWQAEAGGRRARLTGLHVAANGASAWVVGDDGVILASRDGGRHWTSQTEPLGGDLSDVAFAADGLRGWAVGTVVLTTTDGGNRWLPQRGIEAFGTKAVHVAADPNEAWIVGPGSHMRHTRDGGVSWSDSALLSAAAFTDVWISADGTKGWTTDDGGGIAAFPVRNQELPMRLWASPTSALAGLHATADGSLVWAVGTNGTIVASGQGNKQPPRQQSPVAADLMAVSFAQDAARGWAVGVGGTLLHTRDSGALWNVVASGVRSALTQVQVSNDGSRGLIVGHDATILGLQGDGPAAWTPIAHYRRYWAPWYFAAATLLIAALAALIAFVEPVTAGDKGDEPDPIQGGAATTLRSDQPVLDKTADRLGYRAAVEALSSFIRNRATEPRVTIAVTGEWGSGKSSIMRMLQTDLDRAGYRTAWFNVWHHQQEGQQLSALFNAVRQQAVPRWWGGQFVAALRVRSRLIWGRGLLYKSVAIAFAVGFGLVLGDLLADGLGDGWERLHTNLAHHVLQQQQSAITGASLAKLDPTRKPAAPVPAGAASATQLPPATTAGAFAPCEDADKVRAHKKAEPLRLVVYCDLKNNFVWDRGDDGSHCNVDRTDRPDHAKRCVFDSASDLIATINGPRDAPRAAALWPSEAAAVRAAAETLPPAPLLRWLEGSVAGGLAGFVALLFTKGVSVYGLQLLAPVRGLLALGDKKEQAPGKEAAGTIERYRAEFGLLCNALDGRLVIFIDDLDRCTPATVNSVLEMTNYLVDVGRCFVVIGAAVERVKRCIQPPVAAKTSEEAEAYANEYLRKLIHIELPVPLRREELEELLRDRAADAAQPASPRWVTLGLRGRRTAVMALLITGFAAALWSGKRLHDGNDGHSFAVLARPSTPAALFATPAAVGALPPALAASMPGRAESPQREVGIDAPATRSWPLSPLALGLVALAAALAWRWYRRNRDRVTLALGGALRSSDSDRFMRALRVWNPVIVQHDPTPRHVKRFYNRARLFASYESEEARATKQNVTDDAALVAMAAMHHIDPQYLDQLRRMVLDAERSSSDLVQALPLLPARFGPAFAEPPPPPADPPLPPSPALVKALVHAWREHLQSFAGHCPSGAQVQRFADRVSGIHVR